MKNTIIIALSIALFLAVFSMVAQPAAKAPITEKDYHLWHRLQPGKISDLGGWVSFGLLYDSGKDTLVVKSTKGEKAYTFPMGTAGTFGGEAYFACTQNDTLALQNLKTGSRNLFPNTGYFAFLENGRYLLVFTNEQGGRYTLTVRDSDGNTLAAIPNVQSFSVSPEGNALAYATASGGQYKAGLLQFSQKLSWQTMAENTTAPYNHFVLRGQASAFIREGSDPELCHYNFSKKQLVTATAETLKGFPKDSLSVQAAYNALQLSPDGQRLFFMLKENNVPVLDPEKVQVWDTFDRQLYPNKQKYGEPKWQDKRAVWWPGSGRFGQLTDRVLPAGMASPDGRFYLSWDPLAYEPQSDIQGPVDIWLTDLATGKRTLFLKKQPVGGIPFMFSPESRYLSYYREKNWWVYDIKKGTHTNVTAGLPFTIMDEGYDYAGESPAYGRPGWTTNDAAILVYDRFDIWEIAPDGKKAKRLTRGREQQLSFRLEALDAEQHLKIDPSQLATGCFDIENRLVIKGQYAQTGHAGYYTYTQKSGVQPIVLTHKRCEYFRKAAKSETMAYIEDHYDTPARLMVAGIGAGKPQPVFQSNPQHEKYLWGKSETIRYRANGKELSAVLLYPADFKQGSLYPMIVNIYEDQQRTGLIYQNPSMYNETGINFRNFTAAGYFVLLPNIIYEKGNPNLADTMTGCVLAGVDAALEKGYINPKRIGLTGHSFGGYETDMILTKTARFAAAVSGSAFTNQLSTYFYIGKNGKPDWWKAEHQQLRMETSFFEDPVSYINSSPVLQAASVQTPLLSWAGDRDFHVYYHESIEFYLALRRLGKTHTLLLYPNDGHVLNNPSNQVDATRRIQAWLDSYLKPPPEPICAEARKS